MTPDTFLVEVAQPNMQRALEEPGNPAAIVNAILTLDALAGIIHAQVSAAGQTSIVPYEDDRYRDELTRVSPSFQVLRDTAASIKHGELSPKRKKVRLVRGADAVKAIRNQCGLLQAGDSIGGNVIVIEFDPGPGYVRATSIIADTYRMLRRIVDGEGARTDERDRGTFVADLAQ